MELFTQEGARDPVVAQLRGGQPLFGLADVDLDASVRLTEVVQDPELAKDPVSYY